MVVAKMLLILDDVHIEHLTFISSVTNEGRLVQ